MKRILLPMACLTTLLMACTENEYVTKGVSPDQVSFNTYMGQNTRATAMVTANFDNFKVSAFYSETDNWATATAAGAATANFMKDDDVTKDEAGAWSYDNPKYWPKAGYVNFWAWSPAASTNVQMATDAGTPNFGYTVPDGVAAQEDLLAALTTDVEKPDGGKVSLTFSHLLSKIGFAAKLADDYAGATVTVKAMKVKCVENAVVKKGTYTYAADNTVADIWTPDETSHHATTENALLAGATSGLSKTTPVALNGADKFLMLLPQAIEGDAFDVEIDYSVAYSDGVVTENVKKVTIQQGQTWLPGRQYTYNFTISLTDVKFDVLSVNDWGAEGAISFKDADGNETTLAEIGDGTAMMAYEAQSAFSYTTYGVAGIEDADLDDNFDVSFALANTRASSALEGVLTFKTKNKNTTGSDITSAFHLTLVDVLGNKVPATFNLKQDSELDMTFEGSPVTAEQSLAFKSDQGLYSINGATGKAVTDYAIAGVTDAEQITIGNQSSDFTVTATTMGISITPTAALNLGDADGAEATATITLSKGDQTKTFTFKLKQYAKAYLSADGGATAIAGGTSQTVEFKSSMEKYSGVNSYTVKGANSVVGVIGNTDFDIAYTSSTLTISAKNGLTAAGNVDRLLNQTVKLVNIVGEETQYVLDLHQYAAPWIHRSGETSAYTGGQLSYYYNDKNWQNLFPFVVENGTIVSHTITGWFDNDVNGKPGTRRLEVIYDNDAAAFHFKSNASTPGSAQTGGSNVTLQNKIGEQATVTINLRITAVK